jgi:hypothetical protein
VMSGCGGNSAPVAPAAPTTPPAENPTTNATVEPVAP